MKLRYKLLWIGVIWILTLPLGGVFYPVYWKWDFAVLLTYAVWERWTELVRHYIGYSVLGFIFGKIIYPLAILDELLQHFLRGKAFDGLQMWLNILGTFAGVGISKFIKISWRKRKPEIDSDY